MSFVLASEIFKELEHEQEHMQNQNVKKYLGVTKSTGKSAAAFVAVRDKECYICSSKIVFFDKTENRFIAENGQFITFDHILPKSLKGCDALINGKAACSRCNTSRGNETTFETKRGMVTVELRRVIKNSDIKKVVDRALASKRATGNINKFFHEALSERFPTGYISASMIQSAIDWVEHEVGVIITDEMLRHVPKVASGVIKHV